MTKKLAISAALLFAGATMVHAETNIQSVKTAKTDDGGYQIVIKGNDLAAPKVMRAMKDTIYIAEFDGWLRTVHGRKNVNIAGIDSVQYGWFSAKPPKVRFVLRLNDAGVKPVVAPIDGGYTITVVGDKPVVEKPLRKPAIFKDDTKPTVDENGTVIPPTLPYPTEIDPVVRAGSKAVKDSAKSLEMTTPIVAVNGKEVGNNLLDTMNSETTHIRNAKTGANEPIIKRRDAGVKVSLDFVGTDIIQILKALSIQSNVNIVSAPEVSPEDKPVKLTVSLADVFLDDALGYVTAISGLRYGKVGNTYIVTPRDKFSEAMNSVMERMGQATETRVVNLTSGEAEKIKDATLRALPQDGEAGYYDIIVPDAHTIPGVNTAPPTGEAAKGDGTTPPDSSKSAPGKRVYYLMLVGDDERLDQVDEYVRQLDAKIVDSTSMTANAVNKATTVVPVQSGETGRIKQMLDRLIAEHPRGNEFSISESVLEGATKGEAQTMALLLFGPKDDLARMEEWAMALDRDICAIIGKPYADGSQEMAKVWEVVELDYIEPTILELDLKTRFKGLQVSLMPDAVSPGLKGETSISEQNSGATGNGQGGAGAAGDGGQESSTENRSEKRTITGREPMKVVLRGTQAMINEAKSYIAMVDKAPRQVALELRVMELTKEEALRIGIDWDILTGGSVRTFRMNQGLGDTSATAGTLNGQASSDDGQGQYNFLATLDKMNNGRNLIARPNALVSDGRETNLFVGDTVRYIKTIQSSQSGITVETDEVEVGVNFDAGVRIGSNGNVSLALNQNFSILTGFTPVPGGGNLPQTSDRSTNMFVNMKSGETLAIGGLILEQDRKRVSGIPLLKDLPLIGFLFSRTDNSKQRTEIVFFLTANVVDEDSRTEAANPSDVFSTGTDKSVAEDKTGKGSKD